MVHFNAKGLESALGWVPALAASGGGDGGLNDGHQLEGGADGATAALVANELRNAARPPLLAKAGEDAGQLGLAVGVHHLGGGERVGLRVHAHVERRVFAVREAALGDVELRAGNAKVEEDGVHAGHLGLHQQAIQVAEVALQQQRLLLKHLE